MSSLTPSSLPAGPAGSLSSQSETVRAIFFVTGSSDPSLVPRLVEPFSKLGLTPSRVHISSEDGDGAEMSADLRVDNVPPVTAHLIDKALRRIVGVQSVIALVE